MSDYAKMWLQLMFLFYLFMIIIVIVVGSRQSIRIQRLRNVEFYRYWLHYCYLKDITHCATIWDKIHHVVYGVFYFISDYIAIKCSTLTFQKVIKF